MCTSCCITICSPQHEHGFYTQHYMRQVKCLPVREHCLHCCRLFLGCFGLPLASQSLPLIQLSIIFTNFLHACCLTFVTFLALQGLPGLRQSPFILLNLSSKNILPQWMWAVIDGFRCPFGSPSTPFTYFNCPSFPSVSFMHSSPPYHLPYPTGSSRPFSLIRV